MGQSANLPVLELAVRLAHMADEYPRHVAMDALDIAAVFMRSGRDYLSGSEVSPIFDQISEAMNLAKESLDRVVQLQNA